MVGVPPRVAAVIPAYNEERTIVNVLATVSRCRCLDEVIVVSDGSRDGTAGTARCYPCKVIELSENRGKGAAMQAGVAATDAGVIVFLDADLLGLSEHHVADLLLPVVQGEADMTVGIFRQGRLSTDLAQAITPFLSGLRAIGREHIENMADLADSRFGVEMVLTRYARRHHLRVKEVPLRGVSQVMKEEKMGFIPGFRARLRMYWEIVRQGVRGAWR